MEQFDVAIVGYGPAGATLAHLMAQCGLKTLVLERESAHYHLPRAVHFDAEVMRVIQGLREYFHLCNSAGRRMVSMPSQVVDVAWHEFILFTRKYEYFCGKALGRFLHHTPAEAMRSTTSAQAGIKTAWRLSCLREGMQPRTAHRLPLLFAIDAQLNIADGFRYSLDCKRSPGDDYCAGHIGCSSGCGGGCGGDSSGGDGGCGGGGD